MKDGDGLFFLNFRADRAREILAAIGDPGFRRLRHRAPPETGAPFWAWWIIPTAHNAYMTTVFPSGHREHAGRMGGRAGADASSGWPRPRNIRMSPSS
jgi:hypothetical protein